MSVCDVCEVMVRNLTVKSRLSELVHKAKHDRGHVPSYAYWPPGCDFQSRYERFNTVPCFSRELLESSVTPTDRGRQDFIKVLARQELPVEFPQSHLRSGSDFKYSTTSFF